jgi:hypothetical protein
VCDSINTVLFNAYDRVITLSEMCCRNLNDASCVVVTRFLPLFLVYFIIFGGVEVFFFVGVQDLETPVG